jgi:hypothetical protein
MATNTYVALDKVTVGTATPSVTFTGINQGYTDLILVVNGTSASAGDFSLQVGNGSIDTGTNYSMTAIYGSGSTASSARSTSSAAIGTGGFYTAQGTIIIQLMNYSNTTTYKTTLNRTNSSDFVQARVGLWRSTAAINTIKYGPSDGSNWSVGSTFSLYGIKALTVPGTAKATGGTITYDDFGRVIHTFTTSGTFTPSESLSCEYLVIAGGGGGADGTSGYAGGGGGSGQVSASTISLSPSVGYTVTVGAGGAQTTNGNDSIFSSVTSTGGKSGRLGDSGGYSNIAGGGGNNGGGVLLGSTVTTSTAAGGGGGASANGNAGVVYAGGAGGAGLSSTISGASVTRAGGGGGGSSRSAGAGGTGGAGGSGGGGSGGVYLGAAAVAGTANTGGAGGGGGGATGGAGGSGIVIVRYQG